MLDRISSTQPLSVMW